MIRPNSALSFRTRARKALIAAATAVALGLGIPAAPAAQVVVQISVDGLRADLMQQYVTASPATFPNVIRLMTEGSYTYNARCDFDYSESVPNHATMLTGRPVLQPAGQPDTVHHGYDNNFPGATDTLHANGNPNLSYVASVFDVAHDNGLTTALYVGKTRFAILERSYNADNGAPDTEGEDNGTDKIDFQIVQNGGTDLLIDAVVNTLTNASVQYTFLHITDPDGAGHASGWTSAAWSNSIVQLDGFIGRIFDAIDATPALAGEIAFSLTGDHGGGGGIPNNHLDATLPENYTIPFFLWGPNIPAGGDLYDLFPNRFDPGTGRPDYNAAAQPIRNGDAPNLSMALLGLPPIPGSFMEAALAPAETRLDVALDGSVLTVSWPKFPAGFLLETAAALPAIAWMTITDGIEESGSMYVRAFEVAPPPSEAFFRLRQRAFSIRRDPQPVTLHAGATARFEVVTASDNPLMYQWRLNGGDLPGANAADLTLDNVQPGQAGEYAVTVTDGIDTLTSQPALLTVLTAPVITAQPTSRVVALNSSVTFSVAAVGSDPLQYQWRKDGADLPGATGSSLVIPSVQTSDEGSYDVVVSDPYGSTTSDPATLAVQVRPFIVQQPQSQTVRVGENVSFTVVIEGSPPPFSYRWRKVSVTQETQVLEAKTSTFTITNVQLSHAGNYSVVVTNIATVIQGQSALSSTAVLTVQP